MLGRERGAVAPSVVHPVRILEQSDTAAAATRWVEVPHPTPHVSTVASRTAVSGSKFEINASCATSRCANRNPSSVATGAKNAVVIAFTMSRAAVAGTTALTATESV